MRNLAVELPFPTMPGQPSPALVPPAPPQAPIASAGTGASPPAPGSGGVSYPRPKKGQLPVGVIASIQTVFAREEAKLQQLQGMEKPLQLKPGWGGQGK